MLIRSVVPPTSFNPHINELIYDTDELSNNISLYSLQDKTQAVCGIEIIFGGGKIEENSIGSSHFSSNLVKSGTKEFDANQINNFFELRGAFVQVQNGLDFNTISLYCLTDKLQETLPFFFKLFTEPTFPENKLDKLKINKLQELEINEQKSSYWSSRLLKETLFDKHPYGQTLTKDVIESVSRDELIDHWINKSSNNVKFITAAGNFNKNIITKNIETFFSNNVLVENKSPKIITKNKIDLVTKSIENSSQSSLKIGFQTINFSNPNYAALSLTNTLLGGYFGSRLMQSIREEKGLTYGISSSIQHLNEASFIQISADLKAGAGKEVIELINVELNKLSTEKIPEEELSKVKKYLIGEYKSNSESVFDKINKVKFLKSKKLPDTYFTTHFDELLVLKSIAIPKVVKSLYNPNTFTTILVE